MRLQNQVKSVLVVLMTAGTLTLFGQQWEWSRGINMPYAQYLQGVSTCCGTGGNFFVAGHKWDQNYGLPAGSCIIKYDSSGVEKWRKLLSNNIRILKIQTNADGNVFLAGDFKDTINLNGNVYISHGGNDAFLSRLDENGNCNWFKQISGVGDENVQDIYFDKNNNLFITGQFSNGAFVNGVTLNTNGATGSYILKFGTNNNLIWHVTANNIDSSGYNNGYRLQSDTAGNIYLLGNYSQIKIDTTAIGDFSPYGAQYLAKFDSTGQMIFLKGILTFTEKFKDFKVSNTGLYFTGDGGWTSGSWTKTNKYSFDGNLIWTRGHAGFYWGFASNSIVENSSGFYTIGYQSDPNVPNWHETYSLTLSDFDVNGQETQMNIGCIGFVNGYDITRTGEDEFLIIGYMPDSIAFGNFPLTKRDGNIFIAKFKKENIIIPLGLQHLQTDETIIFPNPSKGEFVLQLNEPVKDGTICVYDVFGNCILNTKTNNSIQCSIDLSKNAKGIYFIDVTKAGIKFSKKVIIE